MGSTKADKKVAAAKSRQAKRFVLNMIRTKIITYRKKYGLTSWNAYKRLTEHRSFKELMRLWFKEKNKKSHTGKRQRLNKEALERFIANEESSKDNRPQDKFFVRHILKDATGIQETLLTDWKKYTHKKRRGKK